VLQTNIYRAVLDLAGTLDPPCRFTVSSSLYHLHCTILTVPSTLYHLQLVSVLQLDCCTIYTVPSILYHLYCTIFTVPSSLYHLHCTIFTVPSLLYHLHCTIFIVPSSLYHLHSTIFTVPSSLFSPVQWRHRTKEFCPSQRPLFDILVDLTLLGRLKNFLILHEVEAKNSEYIS